MLADVAGHDRLAARCLVERLDHVQEGALHVTDGQALVYGKALDLAEVRQPRGLRGITSIAPARRDEQAGRFHNPVT